jgi:DnaJ-class molecular chaperone
MSNTSSVKPNLYDVLGVSKDATQEEIKKAYRKLSLQLHPDRNNNSPESTTKYQEINSAYEVIGSEQERANYDRQMNSPFGQHGPVNINPADIFNFLNKNIFQQMGGAMNSGPMNSGPMNMNSGHMPMHMHMNMGEMPMGFGPMHMTMDAFKTNMMRPTPIIITEDVTLSKAYEGCKVPIIIKRWVIENTIKREEIETVYLQIPRGVDDNELVILRGKGNGMSQTNYGDVKIFIKIINDTGFIRNGLDLTYNKTITLKEALCGFSFDLAFIDGRTFKINNGTGNIITNNYSKVIQKMGMVRDDHMGNLLINFTVEFPTELTTEQVEGLMKLL